MKRILILSCLLALAGCSAEPGSEKWCEQKKEQPKSEWSASDAGTYAKNCLFDGSAVGSEEWCKKQDEKPKGEWTGDESASYAKHCIM